MKNTNDFLDEVIYPKLDRKDVVADLNPKLSSSGKHYEIDCPKCLEKRAAYIYLNGFQIECNRKKECAHKTTIWEYVQINRTPQETLQELARLAGVCLPESNEEETLKFRKSLEKTKLLEATMKFYKSQMWTVKGEATRKYLYGRGYSDEDISNMELGFNPSSKETTSHLLSQGYSELTIKETLNFLTSRDDYKLVFPYRNLSGRISSLWGRLTSKSDKSKYLPYNETSKSFPFYLDKARGLKELIIVEGYLDAMIATARGAEGVIALCGSSLTKDHIEAINKHGAKRIFLSLDNDKAGFEGTEQAIKTLLKTGIEVFVLKLPDGYKDPDELITKKGIELFLDLKDKAQSGAKWLGEHIIKKYATQSDVGQRKAIEEMLSCSKTMINPIDRRQILDVFSNSLGLPIEILLSSQKEISKENENTEKLSENQNGDDFFSRLGIVIDDIQFASQLKIWNYNLLESQHKALFASGGLVTGYTKLDEQIFFSKGDFVTIQAMSNHGKSTLMLQLAYRFITNEQNAKKDPMCIFITYESMPLRIQEKLINMISHEHQEDTIIKYNSNTDEKYLYPDKKDFMKTIMIYNELVGQNKIHVLKRVSLENIEKLIDLYKSEYPNRTLVFFLDYLQIIDTNIEADGWERIKAISYALESLAISKEVILFSASQVNEKRETREGRDIYNASTINLDLLNHSHESLTTNPDLKTNYKEKIDGKSICTLTAKKQKHGSTFTLKDYLLFNGHSFQENKNITTSNNTPKKENPKKPSHNHYFERID